MKNAEEQNLREYVWDVVKTAVEMPGTTATEDAAAQATDAIMNRIEVTHSRKCPYCGAVFANTRTTCPSCAHTVIDISFTYDEVEDLSATVAASMERMTERIARGKGASWTKDLALCVARNDILIRRLHAAHPTLAIMGKHE